VILRTCDRPEFLQGAIKSLEAQSFRDFETIVVDSGKRPCDKVLIENLSVPKLYIYEQGAKNGAALNIGLKNSRYPYIAFLDDDDLWDESFLAVMSSEIVEQGCDVLLAGGYYVVGDRKIKRGVHKISRKDILSEIIRDNFILSNALILRKTALVDAGLFNEALATNVDWDMWLRLVLLKKRFKALDHSLSYVRIHEGNISADKIRVGIDQLRVLELCTQSRDSLTPRQRKALDTSIARRKIFLGITLVEKNEIVEGRKKIISGLGKASVVRRLYGAAVLTLSYLLNPEAIHFLIRFINRVTGRYKKRLYFYGP